MSAEAAMSQIDVLFLDTQAGELSGRISDLLGSPAFEDLSFRREVLSDAGDTINAVREPRAILLLLCRRLIARSAAITTSVVQTFHRTPVILIVEADDAGGVFELLKLGAADFIVPPLNAASLLPRLWRAIEQSRLRETLEHTLKENLGLKQLIGESRLFLDQVEKIPLVAAADSSVLICGETGTGKELFARAIHYLSARAANPFVPVNCGAIPVELVENELFGHHRGAFTGASTSEPGLIQEAEGGTLLLDEIDCLPTLAQVKLLRFLQDREYRPLGSSKMRKADVRVLAATNVDPAAAVKEGRLRQDLYYRLNIIPMILPPLRERVNDIPLLARHFLAGYATAAKRTVSSFSPEAMQALLLYGWPGNVRELQHTIERAVVLSRGVVIGMQDIMISGRSDASEKESFQEAKARMISEFERSYIEGLLASYDGNISRAARAANKNRRAFFQLIRKYRIDAQTFKPRQN